MLLGKKLDRIRINFFFDGLIRIRFFYSKAGSGSGPNPAGSATLPLLRGRPAFNLFIFPWLRFCSTVGGLLSYLLFVLGGGGFLSLEECGSSFTLRCKCGFSSSHFLLRLSFCVFRLSYYVSINDGLVFISTLFYEVFPELLVKLKSERPFLIFLHLGWHIKDSSGVSNEPVYKYA